MPLARAGLLPQVSAQASYGRADSQIRTLLNAALAKLHARIVEEAPFVWIAHDVGPRAMSPKVKGVVQPQSWFIDIAPMTID